MRFFEFPALELPIEDDFGDMVIRAKHSACGEDGIPYADYNANSSLSAKVLHNCFGDLASGSPRTDLTALNVQIVWFAQKGASGDARAAVIRTPNNLRIVFVAMAIRSLLLGPYHINWLIPLKVTPQNQRGFCKGRQISLNIVDRDLWMRLFNSKTDISKTNLDKIGNIPVSVLHGFAMPFLLS